VSAQGAGSSPATDDAYDHGTGTPLLLLHGIGGTWHIWKPVLELLEARHRVIALTLPGHCDGPECIATGEATVGGLADQLIEMMRARGVTSAHVAGNSLGGWLSLELARRGFARSVTALSPAGGWSDIAHYHQIRRRFRIFYALMPLILFLSSPFLVFAGVRRLLGRETMEHADRMPAAEFRNSLRAMVKNRIFLALLRTMGRDGPLRALNAGHVPVRIAWSGKDRVIPFEKYGRPIVAVLPDAQATVIAGVGHVPMYDDPQAVAAQILEVTSGVDAADPQRPVRVAA
jgi:pimeloyl-ACP methyl ester carboxylesterase